MIENWPRGKEVELDLPWWPGEPGRGGSRKVPFGGELLVERDDFTETPPRDWKRLAPGREVRLAGAYVIRCEEVVRGEAGEVQALRCSYDPSSFARASAAAGVTAARSTGSTPPAPCRRRSGSTTGSSTSSSPTPLANFLDALNPDSLQDAAGARVEPALRDAAARQPLPVPATGLLLRRPGGVAARLAGVQPDHTLKDTWSARTAAAEGPRPPRERKPAAPTPPADRTAPATRPGPRRAAADPAAAARFERYRGTLRLAESEAHLLSADAGTAAYFDAAVAAGAKPRPPPAGCSTSWRAPRAARRSASCRSPAPPSDAS